MGGGGRRVDKIRGWGGGGRVGVDKKRGVGGGR